MLRESFEINVRGIPMSGLATLHSSQSVRDSLRKAIASSSGFQRWRAGKGLEVRTQPEALDAQVRLYLQETLETLAY